MLSQCDSCDRVNIFKMSELNSLQDRTEKSEQSTWKDHFHLLKKKVNEAEDDISKSVSKALSAPLSSSVVPLISKSAEILEGKNCQA